VCSSDLYNVSPWYKYFCKRVNQNCSNSSAKVASVEETEVVVGASIAPNPTAELFTLSAKKPISAIIVVNSMGANVFELKELEQNTVIQFGQNFTAGYYQVSIKYADGSEGNVKLIKINQ
jgi:hypothetical protein